MAKIFAVNENNDWYLDNTKSLAIATDLQATLEQCEHVMKTLIGELVFAQSRGVLSFSDLLGGSPNLLQYQFRSRNALLGVEGVEKILSFDAGLEDNVVNYTATILTIYSEEPQTIGSGSA